MLIIKFFNPGFITKSKHAKFIYQTKDSCNIYSFDSKSFYIESKYQTIEDYFPTEFQILTCFSDDYYKVWLSDLKMAQNCSCNYEHNLMAKILDEMKIQPYPLFYDKILCIFEEFNNIYFTFIQGHRLFSVSLHKNKILPRYRDLQLDEILK